MSAKNVIERLHQLQDKQCWTEEERRWLLQYLETTDHSELRQLMQEDFNNKVDANASPVKAEYLLLLIHDKIGKEKPKGKLFFLKGSKQIMIAASIMVLLGISIWGYLYHPFKKENTVVAKKKAQHPKERDIAPGRNNAVLTLSDGTTIVLDQAADGELTRQGSSTLVKTKGQLAYQHTNEKSITEKPLYNAVSTANGNQFQILLPDGSKVWLNAASSLRFPVTFSATERRVEITGEAYFEVAPLSLKGAQKVPFLVKVTTASGEGYEVQVVGTHFNINAYDNEAAIRTTLVEGKVKIVKGNQSLMLQPSQEAVWNKASERLNVHPADVEEVAAWKMDRFEFHDADLPSIMRQLSRWYDVDVRFAGPVPSKVYNGSIRRQATLSQVLQILKMADVNYTLDGRTVIIDAD